MAAPDQRRAAIGPKREELEEQQAAIAAIERMRKQALNSGRGNIRLIYGMVELLPRIEGS